MVSPRLSTTYVGLRIVAVLFWFVVSLLIRCPCWNHQSRDRAFAVNDGASQLSASSAPRLSARAFLSVFITYHPRSMFSSDSSVYLMSWRTIWKIVVMPRPDAGCNGSCFPAERFRNSSTAAGNRLWIALAHCRTFGPWYSPYYCLLAWASPSPLAMALAGSKQKPADN